MFHLNILSCEIYNRLELVAIEACWRQAMILYQWNRISSLRWRHNEPDGVSNHWRLDCLLNHLFRRKSKETSKLPVNGLCEGNPPVTGGSPHKAPIMRKMMTSLCILTICAAVNDQKFENEKFRCILWREFHQNDGISVLVYPYIHPWLMVRVSRELVDWKRGVPTVYPKKYAHGFCFAVLCCGYTLTDFPIFIRLTSLALWQSNDCPSASKATLMNMDKYFMWIHYERLHNHNKAKHNKTVCIFLGIYCMARRR